MALSLLGPLNRIINITTTEILNDQVIDKVSNVVGAFLISGVELIRDITAEEEESETEDDEG
jgi:uncharacterized protein YbjQ (UPF0145 family)